ncbi:MAG: substrate-binding domain-containing protein [Nocardioidaceae bacterium]|nr:substrate-binding domain-containing protein [Nocardioidaceae bacterium]
MSPAPRSTARAARLVSTLSVLGLTAVLAACGAQSQADSGSTGSVPAEVTASVTAHRGPVQASYTGSAFDVSGLRGKRVWWVTQYAGNPFLASIGRNLTEALGSVGVEVTTCDGKGNPVDAGACIRQGIAQHADAIQVDGPEPTTYGESLAAAAKAGIPVLSGAAVDVTTTPLFSGLAGQTSQPFGLTGELAADWIVQDSGGKADVLFLTAPDVVGSVSEQKAFAARLDRTCPDCSLSVKGVTLANWANDLGPTTSSELVKNPRITYVVPAFDPMTQFTDPAILQAGRNDVKVVTVNGNLPFLQELRKGSPIKAMVGIDLDALAYLEADQLLRAMAGQPTLTKVVAPVRIFDKTNVGDLKLDGKAADDGSWYAGSGASADLFARLWKR